MFNKKIKKMIKRETGKSIEKGMVRIVNSSNRCFCGKPFDNEGVCANGHLQNKEYDVPENLMKNQKNRHDSIPVKEEECKKRFANRCSICGAYIPEDDNICDNGHMVGVKYTK